MSYVSRWVLDWAYLHGLNATRFNEFYEERRVLGLIGIKEVMVAWSKGHDDRHKQLLG